MQLSAVRGCSRGLGGARAVARSAPESPPASIAAEAQLQAVAAGDAFGEFIPSLVHVVARKAGFVGRQSLNRNSGVLSSAHIRSSAPRRRWLLSSLGRLDDTPRPIGPLLRRPGKRAVNRQVQLLDDLARRRGRCPASLRRGALPSSLVICLACTCGRVHQMQRLRHRSGRLTPLAGRIFMVGIRAGRRCRGTAIRRRCVQIWLGREAGRHRFE